VECLALGFEQEFQRHHVKQEFVNGSCQLLRRSFELREERARLCDEVGAAGVVRPKLIK